MGKTSDALNDLMSSAGASEKDENDPMLVAHMVEEMRHLGGYVEHINTTKFDYWQAGGKVRKALDKLAG